MSVESFVAKEKIEDFVAANVSRFIRIQVLAAVQLLLKGLGTYSTLL